MAHKKKGGRPPAKRPPTKQPAPKPQPAAKQPAAKPQPAAAKPTRAQRIEQAQRDRQRQARKRTALIAGVILLAVGAIATVMINNRRATARTIRAFEAGACQFDRSADGDSGQGRNHVPAPTYRVDPPAGGNHLESASQPGVYTSANLPQDGNLVHSMEHGDIVLWHGPGVSSAALDELRAIADGAADDVLVVPRPSLGDRVVATAWHRRLSCPTVERAPLERFVREYRDKGPEKVPEN